MSSIAGDSNALTAFSDELPLKQPSVITHLIATILTFSVCYPALLLSHTRQENDRSIFNVLRVGRQSAYHGYLIISTLILSFSSAISGVYVIAYHLIPQYNVTVACSTTVFYLLTFLCLYLTISVQLSMVIYCYHCSKTTSFQQLHSGHNVDGRCTINNNNNNNLTSFFDSSLLNKCSKFLASNKQLLTTTSTWLGSFIVVLALYYISIVVYTLSESDIVSGGSEIGSFYITPVLLGCSFLVYGTAVLLHLLSIAKLPRHSTPEYYESILLTLWGFITLCIISTGTAIPNLGPEWRSINLALLWFTGGLFSISLSVQKWMPFLRKRNVFNALVICLTGRAIAVTQTKDSYNSQYQSMLGYLLMAAALSRMVQIVFRKSPVENIPHQLLAQRSSLDDEDEDVAMDVEEEEMDRHGHKKTAKSEKRKPKCKHTIVCASITIVSGFLTSILSICSGILWMGFSKGWLQHARYYINDAATYTNIMLAVSFIWCVYIFGLCTIYKYVKKQSALSDYEYLELPPTALEETGSRTGYRPKSEGVQGIVPTTATLSSYRPVNQSNSDERREHGYMIRHTSNSDPTILSTSPHEYMTTSPTSLPTAQQASGLSSTKLSTIQRPTVGRINTSVGEGERPYLSAINTSRVSANSAQVRTMRPSEYRAKRRSLLVQSPNLNSPVFATTIHRSSGVGGVLPDEVTLLNHETNEHHPSPTTIAYNTVDMTTSPTSATTTISMNRHSSSSNTTLFEDSISSPRLQNNNNRGDQEAAEYFRRNSAGSPTTPTSSSTSVKRISTGILYNRGQQSQQRWSHPPPSPKPS